MKALALWLLVLLFMSKSNEYEQGVRLFVHADTDSVYVEGDSLIGIEDQGEFLQYINGDVLVIYGTTQVTSDRAIRNVSLSQTSFIKNATLVDAKDTLQADSLNYDEELDVGRATGNVRLSDGDVITLAPEGIHYVKDRRIEFPRGLVLEDSAITLSGETGIYWTQDKVADLAGHVEMESKDVQLIADSLTHYRTYSISLARGAVRYRTSSEGDSTWIAGERFEYNAEDSLSIIRGSPLLVHLNQDSSAVDTLIIRSDVLRMQDQTENYHLEASKSVQIWNPSLAARADSMAYDRPQDSEYEVIWLFGRPMIWMDQVQLTGDTARVVMKDGDMDSLFFWGNSFIAAQQDTTTKRIHQVRGKNLVGVLRSDSVRIFTIGPNAEGIYFGTDDNGGADGALEASGDEIQMLFEGDSLRTLKFSTDVQGTRYPETSLPSELSLEGLQWEPAQKPTCEDLLVEFMSGVRPWKH